MTSEDIASLKDFLATQFATIDARLTAIEGRLARIEARQDAMENRLDAVESRLAAVESRLAAVESRLDAVENRLDAVESRLDAVENRLGRVEVLHEETRSDLRRLAEGLAMLNERFDREFGGLHVRFDRFEVDFGTVQLDHGMRITALEQHRRRRGPRG
jgi:septal ring factor EnvC (AmiA/AmiB activator)